MITECKCSNPVEAKLDATTDKVMCQNCGEEIENISQIAKDRMRADGDIVRVGSMHKIPEGGMLIECSNCHKSIVALLNKKNDECFCPLCKTKQNLSSFSKALLRENGQYAGSDKKEEFHGDDLDFSGERNEAVSSEINNIKTVENTPKRKRGRPPKAKM